MSDELVAAVKRLWLPAQHSQGETTVFASDLFLVLSALENLRADLAKAQAEIAAWKKATGRDDPEALDFELGRTGIDTHLRVLSEMHAKAQARCAELTSACVALEDAIHSEPDMSGRLKNLHISPVRGGGPLRRLKALLSEPDGTSALAAVRLMQRALDEVTWGAAIYGDGRLKDDMRAEILAAKEAADEAFGSGE